MYKRNRDIALRPDIVNFYADAARHEGLYKTEEKLLEMLGSELKDMAVLDLGIGGGRTTLRFAPLVREYVGIDYSPRMINACKGIIGYQDLQHVHLVESDASLMPFKDGHFDIVLFLSQGIDALPYNYRLRALAEMKRVARKRAYILFSTHNLNWFKSGGVPALARTDFRTRILFRTLNPPIQNLRDAHYAVIVDGSHDFAVELYYIEPQYQIEQLHNLGFADIRIFDLNGKEIKDRSKLKANNDWALHYLCTTSL